MAFQSGVSLPGQVWDDYRTGTSLAGDIARLVGGGLVGLGGIKRQMDKEEADRAERAAEHARMASQFDRTLAQNDAHFNLGREDKYRLEAFKAAQKQSGGGWDLDENGDPVYLGPTGPAPTLEMPKMSVPEAKAAGAAYRTQPSQDYTPGYGASIPYTEVPVARAELDAFREGVPGASTATPTRLAGTAPVPPLAVLKASRAEKGRMKDDARADEHLSIAQRNEQRQIEEKRLAKEQKDAEEADYNLASAVQAGAYDVPPVFAKDVRRIGGQPVPEFKTAAGAAFGARVLAERQAKAEEERKAQAGYIDQLRTYEDKIPKDSPYYRELTTTDAEGNPLPAKQLAEQLRRVESNLDDQTKAEVTARRRSEIDARRTERNARADAALAGKLAEDAVKAEYAHVEDELRTVERSYAPWDSEKMAQDPTRKELLATREKLAGAIQTAIKARVPTAPVAPAAAAPAPAEVDVSAGKAAYAKMPKEFASAADAEAWLGANAAGLPADPRAALAEITKRRLKTGK